MTSVLKKLGWIIIAFVLALLVNFGADILSNSVFDPLFSHVTKPYDILLDNSLAIAIIVGFIYVINRYLLRNLLPNLLNPKTFLTAKQCLYWIAYGLLLPISVIVCYFLTGMATFSWLDAAPWYVGTASAIIVAMSPGFVEELAWRYIFYGIIRTQISNKVISCLIAGTVFGALHLNQVSDVTSGIQLMIGAISVSILFITIYEVTGSIWPGCVVHTLWDAFTIHYGLIWVNLQTAAEKAHDGFAEILVTTKNPFLSGGGFGVDSGLYAIVMYLLFACVTWTMCNKLRQNR